MRIKEIGGETIYLKFISNYYKEEKHITMNVILFHTLDSSRFVDVLRYFSFKILYNLNLFYPLL